MGTGEGAAAARGETRRGGQKQGWGKGGIDMVALVVVVMVVLLGVEPGASSK